jgi:lactate dehydrogenase-like 2-hydroxyacid dehydrogenase
MRALLNKLSPALEASFQNETMTIDILLIGDFPDATRSKLFERFHLHHFDTVSAALSGLTDEVASQIRGLGTEVNHGAPAPLLTRLPKLEVICCFGIGLDRVDLQLAKARNIWVSNTPGVVSEEVADFTIGLLLASARQIVLGDKFVREGWWRNGTLAPGRSVRGKTLGIVGLGGIGRAVADRAVPFQMNICYYGPRKKLDAPFTYVSNLADLARISDFFVIACKGSQETINLVSPEIIAALRPTATLINVARGNVVNECALVDALASGHLGYAALDVFEREPEVPETLTSLPNVILQPHQAHAAAETRLRVGEAMIANLFAWFDGKRLPTQVV